jgi:hypothetical protein
MGDTVRMVIMMEITDKMEAHRFREEMEVSPI